MRVGQIVTLKKNTSRRLRVLAISDWDIVTVMDLADKTCSKNTEFACELSREARFRKKIYLSAPLRFFGEFLINSDSERITH